MARHISRLKSFSTHHRAIAGRGQIINAKAYLDYSPPKNSKLDLMLSHLKIEAPRIAYFLIRCLRKSSSQILQVAHTLVPTFYLMLSEIFSLQLFFNHTITILKL